MTATFRQNDLRRAIKAARNAGLENFRVTVDKNGLISVVLLAADAAAEPDGAKSGWDKPLNGE
jgi:hypothetical protein